ncbi:unnamed protein product [Urochloa humidicola]
MEHFNRGVEFGMASFERRHSLSCQTEEIRPVDAQKAAGIRCREKSRRRSTSSCHPAAEMPAMPEQAMEFLSRTWSPTSSDLFFQILSPNMSQLGSSSAPEDGEQAGEVSRDEDDKHLDAALPDPGRGQFCDETCEGAVVARGSGTTTRSTVQRRNKLSQQAVWLNGAAHVRAILRRFLLSAVSVTGSQRRRRRDELRLHSAQAHAAVSVAQLAAAVAGMVSVCDLRPPPPPAGRGGGGGDPAGDRRMGAVLASAAALVATVCAEAAATAGGANRARVASAVRAGRESRSPAELLALTATAATSLRGAAALRIRAADVVRGIGDGNSVGSIRASIQKGTTLRVCLPCGRVRVRTVAIFLQGGAVVLRLGKKLLRGTFATHKDYKVLAVVSGDGDSEVVVDGRQFFPLALSTPGGATVQLLFELLAQCKVWMASIEGMLSEQKLKCPMN